MSARRATRATLALVFAAFAADAAAQAAPAQAAPALPAVVETSWLARELARPTLVVLHIGDTASFAAGHIPGAARLDFAADVIAPQAEGGLRMELPEPAALERALRALGVNNDSRIVLVFDQPPAFTRAGRTFFTLEWAGLRGRVAVLDGGLPHWRAEGHPLATGPGRKPAAGNVTVTPERGRLATRDAVLAIAQRSASGRRLVDARTPEFYADERSNGMPRGGHIASAVNLPFNSVTTEDGRLKPRAELEALVAAAGIGPDDALTTYCHIGLQASWMYFTLRALGREVSMYDGSFDEWSRDSSLPIEGPKAARP